MSDTQQNADLAALSGMAAREFLQHREPMLLLDRLVEAQDDYTICEWDVLAGRPFVRPPLGIPSYTGVEFMAQCVAVHAGARARLDGFGPPLGFLLGTRHFRSTVSYFDIGETGRVICRELIRDLNGMGSYDCSILFQDHAVAEARLSVLEKERGQILSD